MHKKRSSIPSPRLKRGSELLKILKRFEPLLQFYKKQDESLGLNEPTNYMKGKNFGGGI